jgi:hypothetical protein
LKLYEPKVVLWENVDGALKRRSGDDTSPKDFILAQFRAANRKYSIQIFRGDSLTWQSWSRARFFAVMVHEDAGGLDLLKKIGEMFAMFQDETRFAKDTTKDLIIEDDEALVDRRLDEIEAQK